MDKVRTAQEWIHEAGSVVVFSGAGMSADSGIATFRGAAVDARWKHHDPMKLASPEGFAADPETVIAWYAERRRTLAAVSPHAGHEALAMHPGFTHVTQNVDDLLERAGIDGQRVHHLHGSLLSDRCHAGCGHRENIDPADPPGLRNCPRCGAPMRPAVVWFGEALDGDVWAAAEQAVLGADLMLVVGTSASVMPAASFIDVARTAGSRIIRIDPEMPATRLAPDGRDLLLAESARQALPQLLAANA
ncbi:MAG: NAD-dependent deacylase [Gammaproteobacteria bacterium]|nr:MAG: NAD-dependent deacylase [Gammaproteobacteria bacterium]